jgi:hypothetical protein
MKAGDIIFVRGKSPLARIVRYFDKGEFSHVCIAVSETHVLEANWNMRTRIREMKYEDYEIVDLELDEYERDEVVHEGIKLIGKWYDYPQITWYMMNKFLSWGSKNKFNSPVNLICSEVIFYILFRIGRIQSNTDINADITPNQLYKYLTHLK